MTGGGEVNINTRPEYIIQPGSQWYERTAGEIGQQELSLGPAGAKKYRLDLLRRVARRVDEFSAACGECESFKSEISRLVQEVNLALQSPGRRVPKNYSRSISRMVEHLKKTHRLVDKWYYVGVGVGIGTALGAGIGAALSGIIGDENIGTVLGPVLGIALGAAVGAYLDVKARREGRII